MAEFSIAVIGLTSEVFSAVLKTCEFISTANGLAQSAPILHWKFRIEEARLQAFGNHWGLSSNAPKDAKGRDGLNEIVCGILKQMKKLFDSIDDISGSIGFEKMALADSDGQVRKKSQPPTQTKPRWASKFKWALKDKEKAERLAKDVRELNDGLYSLLQISEFRAVDSVAQSILLRASSSEGSASSLQDALAEELAESSSNMSTEARKELQISAIAQHAMLVNNSEPVAASGTILQPPVLNHLLTTAAQVPQSIHKNSTALRVLARYEENDGTEGQPTISTGLIEWKEIDRASPFSALIAKRVGQLANLLSSACPKPASFRVLDCVKYFEDDRYPRYGLVFKMPPGSASIEPVTLYDILGRGETGMLPDLGSRFALAQSISQSLLRLHDCGWVHASLRSSNIIIFKASDDQSSLMLDAPYLGGFTYSRPSDPHESTFEYSRPSEEHDVYRRPDLQRSNPFFQGTGKHVRFEQCHDLYSLGIILLEIGLWDRASALKKPQYSPERFLQKLFTAYVPLLGHRMGATYRDVVRALLADVVGENTAATEREANNRSISVDEGNVIELLYGNNDHWATILSRLNVCRA